MYGVTEEAPTGGAATPREERYRRVWEHDRLQPRERVLELDRPPLRLRVLEVGTGSPVLFLPGSGGAGPGWAPLLAELDGYRCLLLDPPNSGLSSRLEYARRTYGEMIAEVLRGELRLPHVHCERGDEMMDDYRQNVLRIAEAIAPGWERQRPFIEETTAPVRDWMIGALAPQPGQTVLELAAGAGDVGFATAARLGEAGRLITTDVSPAMLEVARRRGTELALDNVDYRVMDAERIELEDDSVDGILCRFGYMLMPDPQAALAEARRVLRPGGRISLAVWGPPQRNPFFSLMGVALARHGYLPPPDPTEPGIFTLADPNRVGALLEAAGLGDPRLEDVPVVFSVSGLDDYFAIIADTAGPLGLALRELAQVERSEIADELRKPLSAFAAGRGYRVPGVALTACAS